MWDRFDPRDDRDRGRPGTATLVAAAARAIVIGAGDRDPCDVFTKDLDLPRGSERRPVRERDRVYEIDGERVACWGRSARFGSSSETDLHDFARRFFIARVGALGHLEREGLIRTSPLSSDDRAVTLTDPRT